MRVQNGGRRSATRARAALDEDERYFQRQSLSTPCLAPIVHAKGPFLSPGDLNKVLFAPRGAPAISMAVKLARYTNRGPDVGPVKIRIPSRPTTRGDIDPGVGVKVDEFRSERQGSASWK